MPRIGDLFLIFTLFPQLFFATSLGATKNASIGYCAVGLFSCDTSYRNTRCIPQKWLCDGEIDCVDRSDEAQNCEIQECRPEEFRCQKSGLCLPGVYRCDREVDCGEDVHGVIDDSDEDTEMCGSPITCEPNFHACLTTQICIPLDRFCNGILDCKDGTDEGQFCDKIRPSGCKFGGSPTINAGYRCYCPRGQEPKGNDCIDVNECEQRLKGLPPVCSQKCENLEYKNATSAGFSCSCEEGFELIDGRKCVPKTDSNSALFLISDSSISSRDLAKIQGDRLQETTEKDLNAFDIDIAQGRACFVSSRIIVSDNVDIDDESVFECAPVKDGKLGSTTLSIAPNTYQLSNVKLLKFDWIARNWYLVDTTGRVIILCADERFTLCKTIVYNGVDKPADLVVDPINGYLFYADFGTKHTGVWRFNLDGTERKNMIDKGAVMLQALAIDIHSKTLYYLDTYLELIRAINYDQAGKSRIVASGRILKSMSGMVVLGTRLLLVGRKKIVEYDTMKNSTQKAVLYDDYNVEKMVDRVAIYHESLQMRAPNACQKNNGACSDICVSMPGKEGPKAKCLCKEGYTNRDGKCVIGGVGDPLLIFARIRPASIAGIPLQIESTPLNTSKVEQLMPPIQHLFRPTALTIDSQKMHLYFSDARNFTIYRRSIQKTELEVVIESGLSNCEGLAYEWTSGNIYYTDQGLRHVGVFSSRNPKHRKILLDTEMRNPRAIAVHPIKGYLFFSDWSENADGKAKIERAKLDGSERKTLINRRIQWPNGLSIDFENDFLYWCDAFYAHIERIRLNGSDREIVVASQWVNHPYGLSVYNGFLFWSDFKAGVIKRALLSSTSNATNVVTIYEETSPIFELQIYEQHLQKETTACSKDNGGCEQLCFPMGCKGSVGCEPGKCVCVDGYKVDPLNKKKCIVDPNYKPKAACNDTAMFKCLRHQKCIDKSRLCDGEDDCGDESDEDPKGACKDFKCQNVKDFKCDGTLCIDEKWVCDGRPDCKDKSDEDSKRCEGKATICPSKHFQCEKTKRCIPAAWTCDGQRDCGDGDRSDEVKNYDGELCAEIKTRSTYGCKPSEFSCLNGKCILMKFVCDGMPDCRDASDELNCEHDCVRGYQFQCGAGQPCLPVSFQCDQVVDCPDGSDESNATCPDSFTQSIAKGGCGDKMFECLPGFCIREAFVCDGSADCPNGIDELKCEKKPLTCAVESEWKCLDESRCIPHAFLCDGFIDCGDKSDEANCASSKTVNPHRCIEPNFLCRNDTRNRCISPEKVCDLIQDCPNGDDEGLLCGERMCRRGSLCDHKCFDRPTGYVCSCEDGYALDSDGKTCKKKDPCSFGACSQLCEPHGALPYCYCEAGYEIKSDLFSCKISETSARPSFIYTNRHEIRMLSFGSSQSIPLTSTMRNAIALDYYYEDDDNITIFWTDIANDMIYRGELIKKVLVNIHPVIRHGLWTAEGLAVDWLGKNIYWVDSFLDQIEVAKFDGSMRATVLRGNMSNLRSLSLDPKSGLMFWTDWEETRPRIERATMAGEDRKVIFEVKGVVTGGWPNGITCDLTAQRVYWLDAKSDSIHTITYDGTDHIEVLRDSSHLAHPFSVALFESHVYWTDWRIMAIVRANKWNGTKVQIVESTFTQPFDLKIVHRLKQPRSIKTGPCWPKSDCSHICLINGKIGSKCACPQMMRLKADNKTCEGIEQTLFISSNGSVWAIDLDPPNDPVFPIIGMRGHDGMCK
ncbi:unnamed protein product, partial [Mesorhabditis belari]|uniref:Uncharacterized protein n=1 Tax=Mesorhabditis belari TaxID=2138241 RepID=A0AAF3EVG7_9BILA